MTKCSQCSSEQDLWVMSCGHITCPTCCLQGATCPVCHIVAANAIRIKGGPPSIDLEDAGSEANQLPAAAQTHTQTRSAGSNQMPATQAQSTGSPIVPQSRYGIAYYRLDNKATRLFPCIIPGRRIPTIVGLILAIAVTALITYFMGTSIYDATTPTKTTCRTMACNEDGDARVEFYVKNGETRTTRISFGSSCQSYSGPYECWYYYDGSYEVSLDPNDNGHKGAVASICLLAVLVGALLASICPNCWWALLRPRT